MFKKMIPILLVVFAIIGILDAGKITLDEFSGVIPACAPPFECATVLNSPWAKLGPLPLSVYGLVFYTTFLVLGSLLVLEVKAVSLGSLTLPVVKLARWLGVFGFFFTIYLVTLMAFVIQAWCLYCLISAINCSVLFLLTRVLTTDTQPTLTSTAE